MVAAKYFDDIYFTNTFYADVGGVNVDELNLLEVDFLCRIRFNLNVAPQDYYHYYKDICEHCHSHCRNCGMCKACVLRIGSIRLPTMINCTPYDETPLLRFKQNHNLSPYTSAYASTWYSSTYDYRTQNSMMEYPYMSNQVPVDYNYAYSSHPKGYSNQGYPALQYPMQPSINQTMNNFVYKRDYTYMANEPSELIKENSFYSSVEGDLLF